MLCLSSVNDLISGGYAAMIEAGSETTPGTLNSMILYLMSAPEVVRKAQEGISRVVGNMRSPMWDDDEELPYIWAIVEEVLSITPSCISGQPALHRWRHKVQELLHPQGYRGYRFPVRYPRRSSLVGQARGISPRPISGLSTESRTIRGKGRSEPPRPLGFWRRAAHLSCMHLF